MFAIKLKLFASLISGILKATQLFSPSPLCSLCIVGVEMLLISPINLAMSCAVFFLTFRFWKKFSDCDQIFFFF